MNTPYRFSLRALALLLVVPGLLAACQPGGRNSGLPAEGSAPAADAPASAAADEAVQAPPRAALLEDERNTIDIVKRTKNSVVYVTNIQLVRDTFFRTEEAVPRGSGSGFVWDRSGHIVTNAHVIDEGDIFNVTLPDQQQRRARLVGKEPNKDIAVLKVEGDLAELSPLPVGSSRTLEVGQKVVAIGNPFGFDHTVTTGIVSALGRSIQGFGGLTIRDMIQTDASINPGNSGGPLLNSAGELVGMNTVIISPSGASSGIGFAVPVDTIKKIVPQIITHGKVIRPGLGVSLLSDEYGRRLGVEGVVLFEVPQGSAAYQAGLRGISRDRSGRLTLGDIIKSIDGIRVRSYDDFYNTLDNYKIGDTVTLTVERDGRERQVRVTLMRID
jgi:S1-C subfamily serine protease